MWARKRIDIGILNLMIALWHCLRPPSKRAAASLAARQLPSHNSFICLSVRSGFDLFLSEQDWPKNSEIIFTGLTIPDMPRIARKHQFQPVGVDLDLSKLEPTVNQIQRLLTPHTKAIVVAHLLGGRLPTNEISQITKKHGLLLIEDFAQSYKGQLISSGDVAMFSFGTIKTNTALGGAVMVIADSKLRKKMVSRQNQWPQQSRSQYARRILKYSLVKFISTRPVAGAVRRLCQFLPSQHDAFASGMAKSFSGGDFFKKIRQRPSSPLIYTLINRISNFQPESIDCRIRRGKLLVDTIRNGNPKIRILGDEIEQASYWIFGILVDNPRNLTGILWHHGFDATTQSSLRSLASPDDKNSPPIVGQTACLPPAGKQGKLPNIDFMLSHLVFLPLDRPMPNSEIARMGDVVTRYAIPTTGIDEQQTEYQC
ncbi:DegT/DnrJ/EryC1/StrS family aminotransferase [Mariniblastus sp.]|nr:DegT/DnrJ/EryC1/StrS family aminotransferase [Mariniblastus sp.]